jgi:phosphatidylserine/phosphatidylglycerophosphate/cardiolipin synthase-like enzyme
MRDLVQFAALLAQLCGGPELAQQWVGRISAGIATAADWASLSPDEASFVRAKMVALGLKSSDGAYSPDEVARLQLILGVLKEMPPAPHPRSVEESLVFTLPGEAAQSLEARQRLDLLVQEVITSAEERLIIGGPFWNDRGIELLLPALKPALSIRHVSVVVVAHRPNPGYAATIEHLVEQLRGHGKAGLSWYAGPVGSLMHAKFCVADGKTGYFGTANLTSFGLEEHVEVGVRLTGRQCDELLSMLETLRDLELLTPVGW